MGGSGNEEGESTHSNETNPVLYGLPFERSVEGAHQSETVAQMRDWGVAFTQPFKVSLNMKDSESPPITMRVPPPRFFCIDLKDLKDATSDGHHGCGA